MPKEFILDELEKIPEGSVAGLFCDKCEVVELHKKINDEWVCKYCNKKWDISSL